MPSQTQLEQKLKTLLTSSLLLDAENRLYLEQNAGNLPLFILQQLTELLEQSEAQFKQFLQTGLENDQKGEFLQKLKSIISTTQKSALSAEEKSQAIDADEFLNQQLTSL